MTCWYSGTDELDVLYTSVRKTKGGVKAAAFFLTERRGVRITPESLRLRLREEGDARLSLEMFGLLIEWMQDSGQTFALEALHALNERFGLVAAPVDCERTATEQLDDVDRLSSATIEGSRQMGRVAEKIIEAIQDRHISLKEADEIEQVARDLQKTTERMVQTARHASSSQHR